MMKFTDCPIIDQKDMANNPVIRVQKFYLFSVVLYFTSCCYKFNSD